MAHSFVKVYVHFVWSTKNHRPVLSNENREIVKNHIKQYAGENSIEVMSIAVRPEHVHLVTPLSRSQRIEDITKLAKGESSHWINQNGLTPSRFSWQTGYWAGSVCFQHIDRLREYVDGQDDHHRTKTFREEFEEILRRDGYTQWEIDALLR